MFDSESYALTRASGMSVEVVVSDRAVNSFRARVSIDEMGTAADEACSKGLKHLLIHRCDLDVEFGYGLAGSNPVHRVGFLLESFEIHRY